MSDDLGIRMDEFEAEMVPRLDEVEKNIGLIVDILTTQPGGPWTWEMLDHDEHDKLFDQLFEFVAWLEIRYLQYLSRDEYPLTACWFRHPVAVELITALMVARQSVYQASATVASAALVEWHERCLWPTFRRLVELKVFSNCVKDRKHSETSGRKIENDREALDKYLAAERADHAALNNP